MIKSKNLIILLTSFLLCFAFSGCEKLIGNPEGGYNVLITGYVQDESSQPVKGVKISSGYGSTYTNDNGYFSLIGYYFEDYDTEHDRTVLLTFEKDSNKTENVEIKVDLFIAGTAKIIQKADGAFVQSNQN